MSLSRGWKIGEGNYPPAAPLNGFLETLEA